MKFKKIITHPRVIVLLVCIVLALFMIRPAPDNEGVAIRNVIANSSAERAGIFNPTANDDPIFREIIISIDGQDVKSLDDYYAIMEEIMSRTYDDPIRIETKTHYTFTGTTRRFNFFEQDASYTLYPQPIFDEGTVVGRKNITVEEEVEVPREENGTLLVVNETQNVTREVDDIFYNIIGLQDLGLRVFEAPKSNLRMGLDLQGGTRAILRPEAENIAVVNDNVDVIIESLQQRLNVYGLKDLLIRPATDRLGNTFIVVEIAGATEDEVQTLIGTQGKFEARVGDITVFEGGEDITSVCRSADCAYAEDPRRPCGVVGQGAYACTFSFSITLSQEAAQKQADATANLQVISDEAGNQYLEEELGLYLDGELVESLQIGSDLRGRPVQSIAISGPGTGGSLEEARLASASQMKNLQTLLQTGSLPVKLNIESLDTVSPSLGREFLNNAVLIGIASIIGVFVVIFARYRNPRVAFPITITILAEVVLLLGTAAFIKWNLDLAAIAGILIAVGTGVDHLVVITDETLQKKKGAKKESFKEKIKRAFGIILVAYFTTATAMIFLFWLGVGLLKGFALTTIAGISWGVFVARPAFAAMIEILLNEDE